jgi:hypothetical protein
MNGLENDKMGITRKKGKAKRKAFICLLNSRQSAVVVFSSFLKIRNHHHQSSSIIINHHHHHQESSSTKLGRATSIVLP